MKSKQLYVPKNNLGIGEKNVNLHIEVVNVVNITVGNDSKLSFLRCNVVASTDKKDSLEGIPSLVDDSQQAFPV